MKNLKKATKAFVLAIALLLTGAISAGTVSAETEPYNSFSISIVQPENQIDKSVSYFDLLVTPNQVQELQVQIKNDGDKRMIASVDVNDALTGNNGVKVFLDKGKNDETLKYPVANMSEVLTPEVVVEPNSQMVARIRLSVPNAEINGEILGGIVVKARTENGETAENPEAGVDIKNQVAYILGLKLTMNDNVVKPNLNLLSAQAALVDYRTGVTATLQNDQPVIMNGVKFTGEVYKKGSSTELSKVNITNGEISPNTNFNIVFDWDNRKVEAGTYRLHLKAEFKDDVWEWDEEFKVSDNEADKVNEESFFVEEDNSWMWILLGVVVTLLIVALIGLIFFILWKRRKRKEEEEKLK